MAQRLVIAMSEPGPGHVGGADIKGAAMSGPGSALVAGDQVFIPRALTCSQA